jgi:hypothetical protein
MTSKVWYNFPKRERFCARGRRKQRHAYRGQEYERHLRPKDRSNRRRCFWFYLNMLRLGVWFRSPGCQRDMWKLMTYEARVLGIDLSEV